MCEALRNAVSIQPLSIEDQSFARSLSHHLNLPFMVANSEILLWASEQHGLSLSCPAYDAKAHVRISFHSGSANHRRSYGGGKSQTIAKAVGIEVGIYPQILDATAGLGGDAFVFACLGARVTALERSGILFTMLQDAMKRAAQFAGAEDDSLATIVNRLEFQQADAIDWLASADAPVPEVVYMDPMFPERKKSSSVKKEMQILQRLLEGEPQNEDRLLETALANASHRVVVKRPRHAPPVAGPAPKYALQGKSTRFDIYPIKSLRQ